MLIIKCQMLKVKNLTLLSQKNEKRREFWPRLQPNFAFWLIINRVMAIFSPQPLKKWFWGDFFVEVTPQEESKCKNAQFLQWILKDDDVYFQKITAS